MSRCTKDTMIGCCEECGCNITLGHYSYCSKYIPCKPIQLTEEQREIIRIEGEALMNSAEVKTMSECKTIEDVTDECIELFRITLRNRLKECSTRQATKDRLVEAIQSKFDENNYQQNWKYRIDLYTLNEILEEVEKAINSILDE